MFGPGLHCQPFDFPGFVFGEFFAHLLGKQPVALGALGVFCLSLRNSLQLLEPIGFECALLMPLCCCLDALIITNGLRGAAHGVLNALASLVEGSIHTLAICRLCDIESILIVMALSDDPGDHLLVRIEGVRVDLASKRFDLRICADVTCRFGPEVAGELVGHVGLGNVLVADLVVA